MVFPKLKYVLIIVIGTSSILFSSSPLLSALESTEILVLSNKRVPESVSLAKYYMKNRGIPKKNLLSFLLTDKPDCSREEYQKKVVPRVRRYIKESFPEGSIRCLLTMYGMPLVIQPPEISKTERERINQLRRLREDIKKKIKSKNDKYNHDDLNAELKSIGVKITRLLKINHKSSFDSELSLVLEDEYPLGNWILNPYFIGFKNKKLMISKDKILMVSRLDGPGPEIVKRVIDDSIEAEKSGLQGVAYFDTRYKRPDAGKKVKGGYAKFDQQLHRAADVVKKNGKLDVVVDDNPKVFPEGACPGAALYCGWYSLNKYVDAFDWKKGAVGYHVASSRLWHNMMLKDGIAATVGPVSEPYVSAFPIPEVFFGFLLDGYLSLVECYTISLPYLSWQMVLFGDPLYRPFKSQKQN